MTKEIYKKDKAIIKEISGRNKIFANVYFIISFAFDITFIIIDLFFYNGESLGSSTMTPILIVLWLKFFAFFMRNNGLTVYAGIKGSAAARESFKGSTLFLDTLCCVPVRRESVLRYNMESWYLLTAAMLLPIAETIITALLRYPEMLPYAMLFAAVYFVWTFLLFFQTFAASIKSKKVKRLITAFIVFTILFISSFIVPLFMGIAESKILDQIAGTLTLSPVAGMIILAAAVIYPVIMEFVFRKKVLAKKGVSWFE